MPLKLFELVGTDEQRPFSPYCWRTRMALAHKGLSAESIPWCFTEKDAIAPHKSEKVPVLIDDETSIADMACYPWVVPYKNQGQDIDQFPHVKRWMETIRARPATERAYAITDDKRVESASDIPTTDEAGLSGFHMTLWSGLWVPKDTPKDIVAKLNAAAVDALNDPAVRKQLENLGLQMPPKDQLSPQALGTWQKAEIAKWWPMIKAANVKVD